MHTLHVVVEILLRARPGKGYNWRARFERRGKTGFIDQEEEEIYPKRLRRRRAYGGNLFTHLGGVQARHSQGPESPSV